MKIETTKKEIMSSFPKVYYLLQETGYEISCFFNPDYYTCGKYGWNCDVFNIGNNVALTYGYRPFGKEYPGDKQHELVEKMQKLESRYDEKAIKYETMIRKGREIIKEFFLA